MNTFEVDTLTRDTLSSLAYLGRKDVTDLVERYRREVAPERWPAATIPKLDIDNCGDMAGYVAILLGHKRLCELVHAEAARALETLHKSVWGQYSWAERLCQFMEREPVRHLARFDVPDEWALDTGMRGAAHARYAWFNRILETARCA